ncbi:putative nuclear pore complex protein [Apostichopus japonicus]|uniref:Putative nuclear pore complex protein n=1 Tax=Stichopus japonicus TaxID=307972 RepID=A0A2G8JVC6_STIJA|nr:putative nuclear pore complex protein [Apostichopus japonicus]
MSNILDEMEHFGKEIDGLKSRTRDGKYSVGNKEELRRIRKDMADLDSFKADVLECTKSLNEDVHSIKSKLLNSFALLEESRIRKQRNKDPKFITLLKARELDPQTASKMQEIRGMYHYLDVGSRDVNRSLDMEWEENQRRGNRNGSRKLATPTMDTVYHTLRNHHNIMASQRIALEDIREKLVRAQKYDPIGALYRGPLPSPRFRSDEVEPLALKLSETKLHASRRERRTPASAKKQSLLRDILSRRTQTPMRSSPKVLSREEQVSSPTLSYSSEGSYTPSAPFSKKLDFTDDAGSDPTRGNQETKFQQAITPQRESTPVKDMTNGMPLKQTTMPPKQGMMPPVAAALWAYMMIPVDRTSKQAHKYVLGYCLCISNNSYVSPSQCGRFNEHWEGSSSCWCRKWQRYATTEGGIISDSSLADGVTTDDAPSSFAHTGTGTVLWGADASKATPAQLAGAAALNRLPTKGHGASGEPTTSKLPPNVNIKNLDSLKSTMPPPVTFAAVASSVDTDTAQDTPTVSSKPVEVPTVTSPFVQPSLSTVGASSSVSSSKPSAVIAEAPKSGGSLHTPVAASTPTDTATTVPQSTKFDFGTRNNNASTSVPGGFFLGGAVTENPTGASAVFGGRKAQTSQDTNQTPEAKDGTLKGLLEENPTDSKAPKSALQSKVLCWALNRNLTYLYHTHILYGLYSSPSSQERSCQLYTAGEYCFSCTTTGSSDQFSFASSSSKFGFGGSNSGFSFSQKASTAPNAETSSAFGQSAAITATPSSQPSEAVNASTASTPVETEAAGPFVFPVSKPSIGYPCDCKCSIIWFFFRTDQQQWRDRVEHVCYRYDPSLFATATTSAVPAQTTTDASGFSFASTSSGQSLFGGSGAGKPLFGSPATTTKPSLFGQPASTSAFAVSSSTTTSSGGGFSFGQPTTTSQSFFGQPTSTTQSVFGGQPSPFSTASASSPFGQKSG